MIKTEKLTGAIYLHNPRYPENYNHPETGRQNYINAIAYETAQYHKSVAELLKELINQFKDEYEIEDDVEDDWAISVRDLQDVIMKLENLRLLKKTEGGIPTGTLDVIVSGTGGKSILENLYELQNNVECWCHRCCEEQTGYQHMFRMVLCPTCGNKRCPKATDHRLECSGSNEQSNLDAL